MSEDLKAAVAEAMTYNRMGGLDDGMLADIAFDHGVSVKAIRKALGWETPHD